MNNSIVLAERRDLQVAVERETRHLLEQHLGTDKGRARAAQFGVAFHAAATKTPDIYSCTQESVAIALSVCLMADLTPGGAHPQVWLIPRKRKGVQELNAWIAPHGYRDLARRSGTFLQEVPVWKGEEDDVQKRVESFALGGTYIPAPVDEARSLPDLVGFYLLMRDGTGPRVEFVSRSEVLARRAKSDSAGKGYGPWKDWPVEMARKTALKWAFARGLVGTDQAVSHAVAIEQREDAREPAEEVVEIDSTGLLAEVSQAARAGGVSAENKREVFAYLSAHHGLPENATTEDRWQALQSYMTAHGGVIDGLAEDAVAWAAEQAPAQEE